MDLSDSAANKWALSRFLPMLISSCFFETVKSKSANDSQDSFLIMWLEFFNQGYSWAWEFVGKILTPGVCNLKTGKTEVEYEIGWSVQLENNYR